MYRGAQGLRGAPVGKYWHTDKGYEKDTLKSNHTLPAMGHVVSLYCEDYR